MFSPYVTNKCTVDHVRVLSSVMLRPSTGSSVSPCTSQRTLGCYFEPVNIFFSLSSYLRGKTFSLLYKYRSQKYVGLRVRHYFYRIIIQTRICRHNSSHVYWTRWDAEPNTICNQQQITGVIKAVLTDFELSFCHKFRCTIVSNAKPRDLRFSQKYCWRLRFSVIWLWIDGWAGFDVSKEVLPSKLLKLFSQRHSITSHNT
jgi:hypothetical protein